MKSQEKWSQRHKKVGEKQDEMTKWLLEKHQLSMKAEETLRDGRQTMFVRWHGGQFPWPLLPAKRNNAFPFFLLFSYT
jgi:hypothetical protein